MTEAQRLIYGALRARTRLSEAEVQRASACIHWGSDQLAPMCTRSKRTAMNWLLVGGLGLPGTAMLGPFAWFFKPNM